MEQFFQWIPGDKFFLCRFRLPLLCPRQSNVTSKWGASYYLKWSDIFFMACMHLFQQRMAGENEMIEGSELITETIEKLPATVSREGKGKRLCNKAQYQLVEYHSLPGYLRDNEFIVGHYRPEWPLKQVLLSVFTIHNETLNVWT